MALLGHVNRSIEGGNYGPQRIERTTRLRPRSAPSLDSFSSQKLAEAHAVITSFASDQKFDTTDISLGTIGFVGQEIVKVFPDKQSVQVSPKFGFREYSNAVEVFAAISQSDNVAEAVRTRIISDKVIGEIGREIKGKALEARPPLYQPVQRWRHRRFVAESHEIFSSPPSRFGGVGIVN